MTTINHGNWSFRDPGGDIPDGSVISGGNFSQAYPATAIMVGKTLTITGGNFVNVKLQPEWTVTGGNNAQISRCSHLHPLWVQRGVLAQEPELCAHLVDTDTVTVDGQEIVVQRHYEEKGA